jgi:hypothetical protein
MEKKEEDRVYLALKKFNKKMISDGIDFTALREMTILRELNHDNIVKVSYCCDRFRYQICSTDLIITYLSLMNF